MSRTSSLLCPQRHWDRRTQRLTCRLQGVTAFLHLHALTPRVTPLVPSPASLPEATASSTCKVSSSSAAGGYHHVVVAVAHSAVLVHRTWCSRCLPCTDQRPRRSGGLSTSAYASSCILPFSRCVCGRSVSESHEMVASLGGMRCLKTFCTLWPGWCLSWGVCSLSAAVRSALLACRPPLLASLSPECSGCHDRRSGFLAAQRRVSYEYGRYAHGHTLAGDGHCPDFPSPATVWESWRRVTGVSVI